MRNFMKKRSETTADEPGDPHQIIRRLLKGTPDIVLGTVRIMPPSSPTANYTYIWTRKIKAKTVSQALSKAQYEAFNKAIETNRKIESRLTQIRQSSARNMLESIPGVKKKGTHKRHAKKS